MANCILASAITVYCGPLKTHARHMFFERLQAVCKSHGFPAADQDLGNILKLEAFSEFMLGMVRLNTQSVSDSCKLLPLKQDIIISQWAEDILPSYIYLLSERLANHSAGYIVMLPWKLLLIVQGLRPQTVYSNNLPSNVAVIHYRLAENDELLQVYVHGKLFPFLVTVHSS